MFSKVSKDICFYNFLWNGQSKTRSDLYFASKGVFSTQVSNKKKNKTKQKKTKQNKKKKKKNKKITKTNLAQIKDRLE